MSETDELREYHAEQIAAEAERRLEVLRGENAEECPLKPCPFCNGCDGDPAVYVSNQNGWYVYCKCGARVGYFKTAEFAIAAWNTRAERTCELIDFIEHVLMDEPDIAELSCGHDCMVFREEDIPNYCPSCGAKVVGE